MKQILSQLVTTFLLWITPINPILLAMCVLVFVDWVTGIWSALKQGKFESLHVGHSAVKFAAYCVCILIAHFAETHLLGMDLKLVGMASTFIGLREFSSVLENVDKITGTDTFSKLINKLNKTNDS